MYFAAIEQSIDCSHRLFLPYESKCNRHHGHTYKVHVGLRSSRLDENGMVADYTHVKAVIKKYDHQHLNDFFEPTTAEVFARELYHTIQFMLQESNHSHVKITTVEVSETASSRASYTGEE